MIEGPSGTRRLLLEELALAEAGEFGGERGADGAPDEGGFAGAVEAPGALGLDEAQGFEFGEAAVDALVGGLEARGAFFGGHGLGEEGDEHAEAKGAGPESGGLGGFVAGALGAVAGLKRVEVHRGAGPTGGGGREGVVDEAPADGKAAGGVAGALAGGGEDACGAQVGNIGMHGAVGEAEGGGDFKDAGRAVAEWRVLKQPPGSYGGGGASYNTPRRSYAGGSAEFHLCRKH